VAEFERRRCAYFQPASLSHAAISVGCVFSQADTDKVSLDDILPFMHEQYAATTSGVAPSLLLSLTHFLIQAASSASARAGVMTEVKLKPLRTAMTNNAEIAFIDISSKKPKLLYAPGWSPDQPYSTTETGDSKRAATDGKKPGQTSS
jgi:hypothetical protein